MDTKLIENIVETKTFRKDLDAILQDLKANTETRRRSRERALAITKLQESIMWLGMDLKDMDDKKSPEDSKETAKAAYQRYGKVTEFKNFRGDPMPNWDDLPETIQRAWVAAANPGNPYPNSLVDEL